MTIPYQRIVDQENILCDEGFPAKNQPLGVEKGKPSKEGEKNCEPEPEEEMSTNQKKKSQHQPISGEDGERLEPVLYVRPSRHFGAFFSSTFFSNFFSGM